MSTAQAAGLHKLPNDTGVVRLVSPEQFAQRAESPFDNLHTSPMDDNVACVLLRGELE